MKGYTAAGAGWRLARSLGTLAAEITIVYPDLTCLGTKGDATHAAEALASDHNPFVTGPDGLGIVRAIDVGGNPVTLLKLRAHLYDLGAAHFAPLWSYGYLKGPDSKGCSWPIGTGWNANAGDEGHLHISVTQPDGFHPLAGHAGYSPGIDSAASWGLLTGALSGGALTAAAAAATPIPKELLMTGFRTCAGPDHVKYAYSFGGAWWNVREYDGFVRTLPGNEGHDDLSQGEFDALKMIVASTRKPL